MVASALDEDQLSDGLMFDGSSIAGWKAINESDIDPQARPRGGLRRSVQRHTYDDPVLQCRRSGHGELYVAIRARPRRAPRLISRASGSGDTVFVGPEAEFFMFDDVRFQDGYAGSGFEIDDIELPTNSGRDYEGGNLAHRPRAKGGYFRLPRWTVAQDIRAEMVFDHAGDGVFLATSIITKSPPRSTSLA